MKESNTKNIYDIKRKEKYVVRNSRTNEIGKVIFPHPVLFGVGSDQVPGGLSGSLQQTVDGLSYLVAGENTTITTGSNGQITISSAIPSGSSAAGGGGGGIVFTPYSFNRISVANQSDILADSTTDTLTLVGGTNVSIETNADTDTITISANRTKKFFDITEPLPIAQPYNCSPIDFTTVNFNPDRIDVFLNGQILRSGSVRDYLLQSTSSILFNTALAQGDDILVIIF